MLKIRLSRTGKKSQPAYRVVVQEHSSPVKGKFVEVLGFYRPTMDPKEFKVDLERLQYWLSVGAQPSDTVAALLKKEGIDGMDKFLAPRNKQRKPKKEVPEEEAPAAAPAETPAPEASAAEAPKEEPAPEDKEEAPAPEAEPEEKSE